MEVEYCLFIEEFSLPFGALFHFHVSWMEGQGAFFHQRLVVLTRQCNLLVRSGEVFGKTPLTHWTWTAPSEDRPVPLLRTHEKEASPILT